MLAHPLIATAKGHGPFVPVILYRRTAYQVGQAMADMGDAVRVAAEIAATLREEMRPTLPEGYDFAKV